MKVAFATQDLTRIDAHFGWSRHLVFYDVSAEGSRYLSMRDFGCLSQDGGEAKLAPKLRALRGCVLLFASDVGPVAHARLVRQNVSALQSFAGRPIDEALQDLQMMLRQAPTPWIRKCLQNERMRGLRKV